jgi:hypothetical protein
MTWSWLSFYCSYGLKKWPSTIITRVPRHLLRRLPISMIVLRVFVPLSYIDPRRSCCLRQDRVPGGRLAESKLKNIDLTLHPLPCFLLAETWKGPFAVNKLREGENPTSARSCYPLTRSYSNGCKALPPNVTWRRRLCRMFLIIWT